MSDTRDKENGEGDTSTTDGIPFFGKSKKSKDEADSKAISSLTIDAESDHYNMRHPRRGHAIILNHHKFNDFSLSPREGTFKDAKDLEAMLKALRFDVTVYTDLKYGAIYETLTALAAMDHSSADCLLIVVLTHGDAGKLYARDHQYPVDLLWSSFTGDKAPSLIGKPKIFLLQACRGDETDDGVKVQSVVEADSSPTSYTIPTMADIVVMYSTHDGYFSWRSPLTGSWFIQCICSELEKYADTRDLITILTFVNRRLAYHYRSNVPGNPTMHQKKQIGNIVSSLTRLIYFNDRNN